MYQVVIEKRVYRDLEKIPTSNLDKIYQSINNLEGNPRPTGLKKLKGYSDRYRIRQGDYRIVYVINDEQQIISVILVRHRKDVYRDLN